LTFIVRFTATIPPETVLIKKLVNSFDGADQDLGCGNIAPCGRPMPEPVDGWSKTALFFNSIDLSNNLDWTVKLGVGVSRE